jgi:N-acetylneuraminic acid mutarotase
MLGKWHSYLFLLALIIFCGCDFFSGGDESQSLKSQQQVVFQGTLSNSNSLNFNTPEFSLFIDKSAVNRAKSLRITSNSYFDDFPWANEFLIISKNYSIELEDADPLFFPFAEIGFGTKNEFNPETLFAFSYSEKQGWRIFNSLDDPEAGKIFFQTPAFSRWFLTTRTNPAPNSPTRAPSISASPTLLLSDSSGFPAENLIINTNFFIASHSFIDAANYDFKINAIADRPFSFLLKGRQDQSKEIQSQLKQDGLYKATIDLFNDSPVENAISQNQASATIKIDFSQQQTITLPAKMVLSSEITGPGNLTYINHAAVIFSTELKPTEPVDPQDPPALIVPALTFSSPFSGEKSVAVDRSIILEFNKAIDPVSFAEFFAIFPDPGLDEATLKWNEDGTIVTIDLPTLNGNTEYIIRLQPGIKGQDQTELAQSIDINFSTREDQAPVLVEFYPTSGAILSRNGQLQFIFDEEIASPTFKIEILPAVETSMTFNGNQVTVTPSDKWAAATSYQVRLLSGLSDLLGNQSTQDFSFNFSTDDVIAPTISAFDPANGTTMLSIDPLIQISFDQLVAQAFTFSAAEIGANFSWEPSGKVLTLSFQKSLDFSTDYQIVIDTKAESATGIKLANKFFYHFSTIARPTIIQAQISPAANETNVASDSIICIPFDRPMDREKVQNAFSLLHASGKITTGYFNWTSEKMFFTPEAALIPGQTYQVQLGKNAVDVNGYGIGEDFKYSFSVAQNPQISILSTSPANEAVGVSLDSEIEVLFSGTVDPNSFAFTISPQINGEHFKIWDQNNTRLKISFAEGFTSGTSYQLVFSQGITDVFGQPIKAFAPLGFTCETSSLPRLTSSLPANGASKIVPDTAIELRFNQSMNRESVAAAFYISPSLEIEPSLAWNAESTILTINPGNWLKFGQTYQITLNAEATNEEGIQIGRQKQVTFSTRDQTQAIVESPASASLDIDPTSPIVIEFSSRVNQESAQSSFQAISGAEKREGDFSWNENRMSFVPNSPYGIEEKVVFGFAGAVNDFDGYPVKLPANQSFTTRGENPPQLLSTNPANASINLARDIEIQIVFSERMNTDSVEAVFLPEAGAFIKAWSTDQRTLTIKGLLLKGGTDYRLTVSESSRSEAGKIIAGNRVLEFSTAPIPGPNVIQTEPIPDSDNVSTSASIKIYFDRGIAPSSFAGSFSLQPAIDYDLAYSDDQKVVTVNLLQKPLTATRYQVSIAETMQSLDGQALDKAFVFYFTTESAPEISGIIPNNQATSVPTNSKLEFSFNKAMDKTSVENACKLTSGFNIINCAFNWESPQKVICTPAELRPGKEYQVFIGTEAKDSNGNQMSQSFTANFTTELPPLFRVEFLQPDSGAANTPLDQTVVASFSNPVSIGSIQISYQPAPPSAYSLNLSTDARLLSIIPNGHLKGGQAYQVKILEGTMDIFDSSLANEASLSFTTLMPAVPEVIETMPVAGSYDILLDQQIVVKFNQPMNRETVENAFTITPALNQAIFAWTADYKQFTLSYQGNLTDGTAYQARIGAEARDQFGTSLGIDYLLPFQTLFRPELIVSQLNPAPDSTRVPVQTTIKMVFSKTMNLASIENAFSMTGAGINIPGTLSQNQQTILFTPSSVLTYNQIYNLTLNSSAHDLAQNFIKAPQNWSFTTAPEQGKVWELEVAKTTADTMLSGRSDHTLVAFGSNLYAIGGFDGTYLNDVWRSSDGQNWTRILAPTSSEGAGQFAPRAGHACVVFNGKIWLTGGFAETDTGNRYFDDVWYSENGSIWVKAVAEADYFQRAWHNLVVFNNQLWIIAGETQDANGTKVLLDDCWQSSNGVTWQQKSQITAFFPRKKAAAASVAGKLWVWGGYGKNSQGQTQVLNDNWSTSNGDLWLLNNSVSMFSPRCGMAQTFFSDRFWLAGGSGSESGTNDLFNDVWATTDGLNWFQILENSAGTSSQFSPTTGLAAAAFTDRIFIVGGEKSEGLTNEVWSSQ